MQVHDIPSHDTLSHPAPPLPPVGGRPSHQGDTPPPSGGGRPSCNQWTTPPPSGVCPLCDMCARGHGLCEWVAAPCVEMCLGLV